VKCTKCNQENALKTQLKFGSISHCYDQWKPKCFPEDDLDEITLQVYFAEISEQEEYQFHPLEEFFGIWDSSCKVFRCKVTRPDGGRSSQTPLCMSQLHKLWPFFPLGFCFISIINIEWNLMYSNSPL